MSQQYDISNPDTWENLGALSPSLPEQEAEALPAAPRPVNVPNVADPGTWEDMPQTPAQAGMRLNFRAGKLTPEQAQQAWGMTQKAQLPQSAVLNNMDRVREMLEEHELDAFGQEAPLTAGWMAQDVIRTNIARDDAPSLSALEKVFRDGGTKGIRDAWASGRESGNLTMDLYSLLQQRNRDGSTPELEQRIREVKAQRKTAASYDTEGVMQFVAQATAEQWPIFMHTMSEQAKGMLYGASVGAAAGSIAGGAGAIPGAVLGATVFGSGFTGVGVYNLESALAEEDYRDSGLSPEAARVASRVYGVLASIIEMPETLLGMRVLFGGADKAAAAPAKDVVKMTLQRALGGFAANTAKLQGAEALEEGVQELTQWAVGEVAKYATDVESKEGFADALNQAAHAALKAFAVPFSAAHTVPRFALDVRASGTGGESYVRDMTLAAGQQREQEILSSIDDLSANSKLAQRDPLLYEEAVRAMSQGGTVQTVYIPAGGLAQAFGGMENITATGSEQATRLQGTLETLGLSGDDFFLAVAGGTDLAIPIEKYAAAVAQDKEFASLIAQDRRLTPDGFTVRELDQWARENQGALREAVDAAGRESEQNATHESETREIHWAVQAQLEAAGQPRDVAAANATQMAAVFGTLAQRSGMSPLHLWGTYAPDVAQEGGLTVEAGEVLPMGTPKGDITGQHPNVTTSAAEGQSPVLPVYTSPMDGQPTAPSSPVAGRTLRHTDASTLDDVYAKAAESLAPFQQNITAIAESTGGRALFRPGDGLKSRERAQQKLDRDYDGADAGRVVDVLGGTLLYAAHGDVQAALPEIERMVRDSGGEVVRVKDRFASPSGGYKDVLINVRMPNGLVTELLVTTEAMSEAKNGLGHKLYEAQQLVDEMAASGELEGDALKAVDDIATTLRRAGVAFYGATGQESNETASSSVMIYPLWKTSALLPLLSSSSLYPKLAELLGNMRYSLPSSEATKGMSSYSMKSSTNTGSLGVPFSHGTPLASLPSKNTTLDAIDVSPVSEESIAQNEATGNVGKGILPGAALSISLADGTELPGRFEVRDAAAVIPSHDVQRNFAKHAAYPANTQERPYHSSADEQQKVRNNAAALDTRYVISDNPDAVNGPPIVTEDGMVLGGNSRAMSIQLAYAEHPDRAQQYKAVLAEKAAAFGLDPATIESMNAPMLVRVAKGSFDGKQQARLVRLMNQSRTQGLDAHAEAVSRGRLVSQETLGTLAAAMQEHDTLLQYLATSKSRALVDSLAADGVLEETQRSRMTNSETGMLNDEGKRFVQLVLRGRALPDYDIIDAAPASALQGIDRILPHVAVMQSLGGAWDLTPTLTAAMRQIIKWKATGYKQIDTYFNQGNMIADAERDNPQVRTLATLFAEGRPTKVGEAFARYAQMAQQGGVGMVSLPGVPMPTPETAFQKAFGGNVDLTFNQQGFPDIVGRITSELAAHLPLQKPGDIVLDDAGLAHIEKEHGKQIRIAGFADARAFVNYVLQNVDAVYQGNSRRIFQLVVRDKSPFKQAVIRLEFSESGDFYRIKTAGPAREDFFKNKTPLWERAQSNLFQSGESDAGNTSANANPQQTGTPGASTEITSGDTGQSGVMSVMNISSGTTAVNDVRRGRITFSTPSGRPLITLFQQADESTFLHESGHLYLEMLRSLGTAAKAAPELARLWQEAQSLLERATGQGILDEAGNIRTAAHEAWASSLEGYFMKGEAPSMELRGVFAKFAAWLKAIYNAWRSMGVSPSAELRPVFDRLFATDAQMAEVEAWHEAQKPWAQLIADNEAQARQLAEQQRQAREDARARRMASLSRAYMQALGGRRRFFDEARATVNAMPVYAVMDEAARGAGLDRDTVYALMGEERGRQLGKKRPGLLRVEGGDDPMVLAARHGFDSTQHMLSQLLDAENKRVAVSRLAAQQEQGLREKIAQGVAENEAMPGDAEYHSDAQLAVLLAQRQLLTGRQRLEAGREQQKAAHVEAAALREAARAAVAAMPVREAMQAHRHSLAERRAARQAWEAAKAGNGDKAAQYKRQEAVSHAMYLAAAEAREQVRQGVERVKATAGFRKLSADARDIILDMAYRHGITPYSGGSIADGYTAWQRDASRDGRTFPTLEQWAQGVAALGYPVAIADSVLTGSAPQDYREMTLAAFGDVVSAIEQVRRVDRLENTALVKGKRVELAELRDALEQAAAGCKKPDVRSRYKRDKGKELLGGIHAMHAKMEHILLDLDGWKHGGIWWSTFFAPVAAAENARSDMLRGISAQLKTLAGGIMPGRTDKYRFFNDRVYIAEVQDSLTMNQMVSVALNLGNAANRQRLLEGEGWTQGQLDAVLARLEKPHWDFVQGVWDYLETFREPSFALQRAMTGASPAAVEATPVQTPFGEYRGGYYPIAYDVQRGAEAFAREQKELDKQLFGGRNYGSAMTRHGHLKERAKKGTGERLNLDVGVIADHLYNTAHDLAHRKAVVEVAKVMRHKPIMQVVEAYAGREVSRELLPWLQDVANEMQTREGVTQLHRWARWARRGTTMMQMGLKATTIIQQPLGILQTVAVLGARDTMRGVWEVYHRPDKMMERARQVMEQSAFMRNRLTGFDREIRDAMKNLALTGQVTAEVERFAYMGIGLVQMGVDIPTWVGAYGKALAEGKEEAQAVEYADSMVRVTQSSGMGKDLARVQRGSDLMRLFTMFYGYFNALYNLAWRQRALTKGWKDVPAAAASALLLWFLPAVLSEMVSGRGPDDDEGEEWAPWMVQKIALYPLQMLVGVRDVANFTAEAKYGYQLSPAASAGKALGAWPRSVMKALEEDDPAKLIKPTVEGLGYLFVLPLKQPMITVGNIYDYATGETPDFQLRDLVFTKQKSRR